MTFRRPKLKRRKLSSLRVPGVYVLFKNGEPVYVGQSQDVPQRVRDHAWPSSATKHAYRGGFDEYAVIEKRDAAQRTYLEKYLIAFFKPEGNQEIPMARADLRNLGIALGLHRDGFSEEAETVPN
jgi:hypothetical protein